MRSRRISGQSSCGEPKAVSMTETISRLPGGRSCSATVAGESSMQEVESRIGPPIASVPQAEVRVRSRRIFGQSSRGEPKAVSMTETISSLPGGRGS